MKILSFLLSFAIFAPAFVFAAPLEFRGVADAIVSITGFINTILVPAIFTLAFLVFLWGIFKTFILGGHDEEAQAQGKKLMIYAIAGFVIMVSIWGIVNFVAGAFGFREANLQGIPVVPTR